MPVMGANELLPALKARQPKLKILLTSGYNESEARRLCAARRKGRVKPGKPAARALSQLPLR